MRWQTGRRSTNVEDRRGMPVGGGLKIGGVGILLALIIGWLTGANPLEILMLLSQQQPGAVSDQPAPAPTSGDPETDMVSAVLADTEDTWSEIFRSSGRQYQPPRLVLFNDAVQSACGMNSAAVGPFYCPPDQKVYIDLSFFRELDRRFGAPGDFAQAYVIAHEVGHHVQNLLGISERVQSMRGRIGEADSNALSVRQELQADCFAGVWGHHADRQRHWLEQGDVEEGLKAAASIGDDRLQKQSGGYISPESFTHGSSEQRVTWLRRGLTDGSVQSCDTFRSGS